MTLLQSPMPSQPKLPNRDQLLGQFWSDYWGVSHLPDISELNQDFERVLNEALSRTKVRMFLHKNAGFLGSLMSSHSYEWSDIIMTADNNGSRIRWNPWFFWSLSPETRVTVLAHELWHTAYDHMGRFMDHDPEDFNKAADFVINIDLADSGYSFVGIEWGCLDPRFRGMHTQEVYDIIHVPKPPPPGGSGAMEPMESDGGDGTSPEDIMANAEKHRGQPIPANDLAPPEPGQEAEIERKTKVVKAIQVAQMSDQAGSLPGEVTLILDKFLNPVLPWPQLLKRWFSEMSRDDYSWARPNRRYENIYLPHISGNNGLEHLMFFYDISGSVTDEQIYFANSEVKHIFNTYRPKRLTLVTFDDGIRDVYEFAQDGKFKDIKVIGRGGTSLDPVRAYIKKRKPTGVVIFSDLYCTPMGDNPGPPILWVVLDNKSASVRFGKKVHVTADMKAA